MMNGAHMNNKEIADRLRKAADELEGDAECLRGMSTIYDVSAYGMQCVGIECKVSAGGVDLKMKYIKDLSLNV